MPADRPTLSELEQTTPFEARHIGPAPDDQAKMLAALGFASLDELVDRAVPDAIKPIEPLDLPGPASEQRGAGRPAQRSPQATRS